MDYWIGDVKYTIEDCDTKTILDLLKQILDNGVSIYNSELESRIKSVELEIADLQYSANFTGLGRMFSAIDNDWWMNLTPQQPQYFIGDGTSASSSDYTFSITRYSDSVSSGGYYVIAFNPDADDTNLLKPTTPINITLPDPYNTLPVYFIRIPHSNMTTAHNINTLFYNSPFISAVDVNNITFDKIGGVGYTAGLSYTQNEYKLFLPIIYRSTDTATSKFRLVSNSIDFDTNTLNYIPTTSPISFTL